MNNFADRLSLFCDYFVDYAIKVFHCYGIFKYIYFTIINRKKIQKCFRSSCSFLKYQKSGELLLIDASYSTVRIKIKYLGNEKYVTNAMPRVLDNILENNARIAPRNVHLS